MPRIMTYNVHSCVGVDKRLDVDRIAAVIAAARPDVVALQELDVGRARTGGVDQAQAIAARLNMTVHFNASLRVAEERYGDAVLTHHPMRLVKSGPLPTLRGVRGLESRGALWVEIEIDGARLQVINTHLGLVPLEQQAQARTLLGLEWAGAPAFAGPALLIGDFNATPRYAVYRSLTGVLADAQRELRRQGLLKRTLRTFPSRVPMLRIDHAFVSPAIEMTGVRTPSDVVARTASDHLPLVFDFEIKAG